jgi:preprotein translocase subunit SecY
LKINTAGVIPPIFASSIIAFPATIAGFLRRRGSRRSVHNCRPDRCFTR